MKPLGDRREHVRLDVVGTLWGDLEIDAVARLVNISDTGVLIAAAGAPPVNSVQPLWLRIDEREVRVDARVRHARRVLTDDGREEHLIGLEFVSDASPGPPDGG